ncbi:MAG: complex I NDUFA9 subunit family protein, partial [Pseudomonadota bacterium]
KFRAVQEQGARNVAEACASKGIPLVHVSAIGADANGQSQYAQTKGRAENWVRDTHSAHSIIMRPSIVFGPEDGFFNKFAGMARLSPVLPLIGGGVTKFQPVYVGDVAEAIALAIDGKLQSGKTYELGGPEVLTFRQCLEEMLAIIERKRAFASIPFWAASIQGRIAQMLPNPILTEDQVTLLKRDNIVSEDAKREARTLDGIGITGKTLEAILPTYLWQFREHGQYRNAARREADAHKDV